MFWLSLVLVCTRDWKAWWKCLPLNGILVFLITVGIWLPRSCLVFFKDAQLIWGFILLLRFPLFSILPNLLLLSLNVICERYTMLAYFRFLELIQNSFLCGLGYLDFLLFFSILHHYILMYMCMPPFDLSWVFLRRSLWLLDRYLILTCNR